MARDHLRDYNIDWYGPSGHESFRKSFALNVLSPHIANALKTAKAVTTPNTHIVEICYRDDGECFEVYPRHPKTNWLYWAKDYRELDTLPFDAQNAEIGEFQIKIAEELKERVRKTKLVEGFPFDAVDSAILAFREASYSFTSKPSRYKKLDASPLTARFQMHGTCLETTVTMILYLDRKELHREVIATFDAGRWNLASHTSSFDLYDNQFTFLSFDITRPAPVLKYDALPESVQAYLPTNRQLHKEWGTPYPGDG